MGDENTEEKHLIEEKLPFNRFERSILDRIYHYFNRRNPKNPAEIMTSMGYIETNNGFEKEGVYHYEHFLCEIQELVRRLYKAGWNIVEVIERYSSSGRYIVYGNPSQWVTEYRTLKEPEEFIVDVSSGRQNLKISLKPRAKDNDLHGFPVWYRLLANIESQ